MTPDTVLFSKSQHRDLLTICQFKFHLKYTKTLEYKIKINAYCIAGNIDMEFNLTF